MPNSRKVMDSLMERKLAKNLGDLKAALFSAKDGEVACNAINKLTKHAKKGNDQAKKVLADYVCDGSINHMRGFACSGLAGAISEADNEFAKVFLRGLTDPHTRYGSILGLIKTSGKGAYEELTKIAGEDIQRIQARWVLPSIYLDFLTRFSPIKVTIENRKFYNPFQLFGAGELIEAQEGYSFNPVEQRPIEDWPAHLVVIASHGGDPFVVDLSKSDGKEAPVDTAEHGAGAWDFSRVAPSFSLFLETLAK